MNASGTKTETVSAVRCRLRAGREYQGLGGTLTRPLFNSVSSGRVTQRAIFRLALSPPGFPGGSVIKNLPAKQETWIGSLGWEGPLEKEMAAHSSVPA